ncbi:heterokaryon incompatibility protein-domain-containing protein [Suillus paluster]|uniref:heterokaryon incompatibility protein-domain-containing protein n=1 Tax=Suillus paluster TaxID=48578 RepID=UPI001B87749F|nr:heterokaryon incompatibility protein-domain-containing protein [Suillus paluster]KAG1725002.1 heterokaryon incompatibility protein-domain-containing protein [Suillus paluster]
MTHVSFGPDPRGPHTILTAHCGTHICIVPQGRSRKQSYRRCTISAPSLKTLYNLSEFECEDLSRVQTSRLAEHLLTHVHSVICHERDMKFVGRDNVRKHFRGSVGWTPYDFDPSRHVKYAILSHRWLDGGEPTYEEMRAGTASGLGYEKLMKFCEKAREYGVEFGWSDTCCIDKSSSTELDESIRSMFRWYRNATICIVHLANSEAIEDVLFDEWTRRGWTLQELLAPYHIKFFNKHWIPLTGDINDKVSKGVELMETLERATGIPRHELCWFNAGSMRVDERMVWAARRKTTRVEDVAYSLMGMFDVSLQIEYGEGGERAFRRLMEAIMQAGDPSVLNWSFVGSPKLGLAETRLEMNMTTLGLRVPLVILPLNLRSYLDDCGINIALDCPLCPTIQVIITTSGYVPSQMEFALGIVQLFNFQW